MAGSSGGRTAKDLVFLQLMVRPNFLQHVERESSMAVRSDLLLARRAMSSAYSRSVTNVSSFGILLFLTRTGHPDATPLLPVLLQGHASGNIKVKIEKSGCQHTALTNTAGDRELVSEFLVCPNSSSRAFM